MVDTTEGAATMNLWLSECPYVDTSLRNSTNKALPGPAERLVSFVIIIAGSLTSLGDARVDAAFAFKLSGKCPR